MTWRAYLWAWAALCGTSVGGWYLLGMLELGVVDGTGVAPLWLRGLYGLELVLLLPIAWPLLELAPSIGSFSLGGLALLVIVVAVNSACLPGLVWLVRRRTGASSAGQGDRADR